MSYPYKKVFMIGATSGIGLALTRRLASVGVHVIASGRRTAALSALQREFGASLVTPLELDITALDRLDAAVAAVTAAHPDLDQVVVNAGIQRGTDFAKPAEINFDVFGAELVTNYTAPVKLTLAFLPFLRRRAEVGPASIVYTTSNLAITPLARCAGYSASKAALHAFVLCLREQEHDLGSGLRIVELLPPAVQTELHDAKHQPDIKDGGSIGIPLREFTDEAYAGLQDGREQIFVRTPELARRAEETRQEGMRVMRDRIRGVQKA